MISVKHCKKRDRRFTDRIYPGRRICDLFFIGRAAPRQMILQSRIICFAVLYRNRPNPREETSEQRSAFGCSFAPLPIKPNPCSGASPEQRSAFGCFSALPPSQIKNHLPGFALSPAKSNAGIKLSAAVSAPWIKPFSSPKSIASSTNASYSSTVTLRVSSGNSTE